MSRNALVLILFLVSISVGAVEVPVENIDCKRSVGETADEIPVYREMKSNLYEVRRTFDKFEFIQVVVPDVMKGVRLSSVSVTYRNEGIVEWSTGLSGETLGARFESSQFVIRPSLVKNIEFTANYINYLECEGIEFIQGMFVYRLNHITSRST